MKTQNSIDYLFERKLILNIEPAPALKVQDLCNAWINATVDKKTDLQEALKTQLKELDNQKLKQIYIRTDFFIHEYRFEYKIQENEKATFIDYLLRQVHKAKPTEARDFILDLFMSSTQYIEKPRDVMSRILLKLVMNMHQDLVIQELLGPNQQKKKKKKRKTKKTEEEQKL